MNDTIRARAHEEGISLMEFILRKNKEIGARTGINRTIFAACPNSRAVITAALQSAKRANAPIKFATTLNQVDRDGGYTGLTPGEFVKTIRQEARSINLQSPVIIAIDHGGPWLKDRHRLDGLDFKETNDEVKRSFEAAMDAGYDLIHVDPTIDITLGKNEVIPIELVVRRTVELISHCEKYRNKEKIAKIAYEVGTEEVHGGLVNMEVFRTFFRLLKDGLEKEGLKEIWPCFVVGKVGTDLHTTEFDSEVAGTIVAIADSYGSVIKGHYSDNVLNPEAYPESGMGGANVGPKFTEREYEGLMELCELEEELYNLGKVPRHSGLKDALWRAVIESGRWKKWLAAGEDAEDFYAITPSRQEWLIKTGCRYIWEDPEVVAKRWYLYSNLGNNGICAEKILLTHIEKAMDRYFNKFNLVDLNNLLLE
jgi:tagatose-1,6-bisphosphate aldolase non-catalytic subunit AgaZ/GatZ